MEIVSYENLITAVRDNIVEVIENNITDPISSASFKRKWLYSRQPDRKSRDFSGFPYIVIPSPQISLQETQTYDMTQTEVSWDTEITIHASDRGWGNQNGRGLEWTNSISNEVMKVFLNRQVRQLLQENNMYFSRPEISNIDVIELDNTLIYEVSVFLPFKSRLTISE